METLIRSAQLGSARTRLSEARAHAATPAVHQAAAALREEIEGQVRAECAAKAQKIYETEHARARAEGEAAAVSNALATATEELEHARDELTTRVDRVLSAMEQAHQAALSKLESAVGEVAFAALCRLVSRQLASRIFTLDVVERTCAQLRADVVATARLHPRDIDTLNDLLHDQELRVRSLGLKVIPDESLELGGCVIEAASGQYDGGLESQLRRLHAVLTGQRLTIRADDQG